MADLTIKFKGNPIVELSESGTKTLKTAGKYCEGDITVEYVKPAGAQVVMGTVTSSSASTLTIAPGFEPTMAILTIAGNTKVNSSAGAGSHDQSIKIIFQDGKALLKKSIAGTYAASATETLTTSYSNGSFVFTSQRRFLMAGTYDWMAAS